MDSVSDQVSLNTEEILPHIGEFDRFQWILDAIVFSMYLPIGIQTFIMYFSTITPTWKCRRNTTKCLLNGTLAPDDSRRCNIPRADWYYTEEKHFSLVTQFDIDCTEEWQLHLVSSIFFVGWGFGALVLGWMGDKYGRKALMFPSVTIILLVGFVSAFAINIYFIVASYFIIGFFYPGAVLQSFILFTELVGSKHRPLAASFPLMAFPVGWSLLALQGYLLKNWKLLSITCTVPYIFILSFYTFVPESVRWLQINGRVDEAMRIFKKIARWNKRELPSNIVLSSTITSQTSNVIDLFRTRTIAVESLVQCYLWFVVALCSYGLHFAANDIGGSVYRDFFILGLTELPANMCAVAFCNQFGRKKSTLISLLLGGLSSIAVAFLPAVGNLKIVRILFGVAGKYFSGIAFYSIYIWSAEIFPTDVRSSGMGVLHVSARIGSAGAPWVAKGLKQFGMTVPFLVMGVPALTAALLGMKLPETKDTVLKDHINTKQQDVIVSRTPQDHISEEQQETTCVTQPPHTGGNVVDGPTCNCNLCNYEFANEC